MTRPSDATGWDVTGRTVVHAFWFSWLSIFFGRGDPDLLDALIAWVLALAEAATP